MNKELYYPYVNDEGRTVAGNASLLHHISDVGGIQKYNDEIGKEYIAEFVKGHSDIINTNIITNDKRRKFKAV